MREPVQMVQSHSTYVVYQLEMVHQNGINFCYVIIDKETRKSAVIDPAWNLGLITQLLQTEKGELTSILLTHSHYDHVNLVVPLAMMYNCQVYISSTERDYYRFQCPSLNVVEDLETLIVGNTGISCCSTPGHTIGSMCFLLDGCLFSGDTLFIEGCGICTTAGGSPEDMFDSLQRIKSVVPSDTCVYPGHSYGKEPGYPLKYLYQNNIYMMIEDKKHFIHFRMRPGQKYY